jgi:hypothetical protein
MIGNKAFVVVAITAALGAIAVSSATAADQRGGRGQGQVQPCSLDGVNPAYHPEIFGNAAVAASYGFVRSSDGTWHVRPNCRR